MPRNLLVNGEILLYGDVGDPFGWGDGFSDSDVADALAEHGDGAVKVRINSGGGLAHQGMAIYSLLKAHPGKVTIAIDGVAASAASLIAMAGAEREIRTGATIMIHDPSGITLGTEEIHRKAADKLGKLADSYAGVYASNSGNKKADVRALMKAETWLSADEAVAQGFCTKTIEDQSVEKAAFDYRVYAKAPPSLPVRMRTNLNLPAASAALPKEPATMKKEWAVAFYTAAETSGFAIKDLNEIVAKAETREAADAALAAAVAAKKEKDAAAALAAANKTEKAWAASFYASASASNVSLKDLNEIVASCDTVEKAKDKLIDAMAKVGNDGKPGGDAGHITLGADDRTKLVAGATKSLIGKVALFNEGGKPDKDGERNEFSTLSLRELARMCLERNGIRTSVLHDPMAMIARAMEPVIMAGSLSTSDFVNILANVANKAMLKGYDESLETFEKWTGKGTLTDFKVSTRVDLGLFPSLAKVEEGAEYKYASVSDRKVTLVLSTYGKIFAITRQAIVNDDLGAFTKIPSRMGQAAKRTIGNLVYAVLTDNAAMADAVALFHATHNNLITTSALAAGTLDAGRAAMAKQRDPDNIKQGLNIRPAFLLLPVALEGVGKQLMTSQAEPGQSNPSVGNRVAGMAEVVSEARLDVNSATTWYLAGNPNQYDTIEVSYLNGVQTPVLEQKNGWNVDGVEFKVRQDAGVNLLDFRALLKATA